MAFNARLTVRYPAAGTTNPDVSLWLCRLEGGDAAAVEWDRASFEYLEKVCWNDHGLTITVRSRDQSDIVRMAASMLGTKATIFMPEAMTESPASGGIGSLRIGTFSVVGLVKIDIAYLRRLQAGERSDAKAKLTGRAELTSHTVGRVPWRRRDRWWNRRARGRVRRCIGSGH